jgi:hypothetical protein
MLRLSDLNPRTNYCVVRDPENRESIVTRGDEIQRTWRRNRDYYHYAPTQAPWHEYLRLDCGDGVVLAVWRDPTRPELNNVDDAGTLMTVEEDLADAPPSTPPVVTATTPVVAPVSQDWTLGLASVLTALRKAAGEVVSTLHHG